jgi:glycerol-3-phosphate acyltransferase PlsY
VTHAALLVSAFLVGAVPFAWLAVKLAFGADLREHGSGNPGATNAARMWTGKGRQLAAFLAIFALDAGKGCLATGVLPPLLGCEDPAPVFAAVAVVLGHAFTPFLRFRGGKGVATTIGAFLALDLFATSAALAVFLIVYLWTRIVAAGSIAFAVTLPVAVRVNGPRSVFVLALCLCALIVVLHRSNIARMLRGKET